MKRLLLSLTLPVLLSACFARGGYVAVVSEPPPPRAVVVESRPGYVWIDGHWNWNGSSWYWGDGYWDRDRPGYGYVQGGWIVHGGSHHWRQGYWRPQPRPGTVVVPSNRPRPPAGKWRPTPRDEVRVHDNRN